MQRDKNMPKILILGAKGMLGQDLAKVFEDLEPVLWDKDDLDITDKMAVAEKISALKPDIMINAAAYTAVDDCETNKDLAVNVNGIAPGYLAQACKNIDAWLIHYSTDYVFGGGDKNGYKEDDSRLVPPLNLYGKTKLLGEQFIQEAGGNCCSGCEHKCDIASVGEDTNQNELKYYIIRTSWLYGKNGPNFVDKILALAKDRDIIKVVNDQFGKPTYTWDLAQKTRELAEGGYPPGIYHVTNEVKGEKKMSWFDFASEIVRVGKKKGLVAGQVKVTPCASDEFPRPAKRPQYSMLRNTKLNRTREWREALEEYISAK